VEIGYIARTLPPVIAILPQAFLHHAVERWRCHRLKRGHRRRVTFQNRRNQAGLALALERSLSSRHFVDHCAKRKDVRARIQFFPFQLFWGHGLQSSNNCPLRRQRVTRRGKFGKLHVGRSNFLLQLRQYLRLGCVMKLKQYLEREQIPQ
jgi:hypothetical protein